VLGLTRLRFFNSVPAYEVRESWTAMKSKPQELQEAGAGPKPVNLLAAVDPQRDGVRGAWRRNPETGELISDGSEFAQVEIPYQPPEEYDFEIRFTRLAGGDFVAQLAVQNTHQFAWAMGNYRGTVAGFMCIGGKTPPDHPNTVWPAPSLVNGKPRWSVIQDRKPYWSVIQVRKDGLTAYLDGKLLTHWKTDGTNLTLPWWTKLRSKNTLGLSTYSSPTIFHAANLYEVTGQGKAVDVAPAAPLNPDTPVKPPAPPKKEPAAEF